MAVIGALLRVLSHLFHFVLALFLLGISVVSLSSGHPLRLEMLPWQGQQETFWTLGLGCAGLLSVLLVWAGRLRFLFFLYALAIFGLAVWGFFLTPYTFSGPGEFRWTLLFTAAALLAIFGAWPRWKKERYRPVR